MDKLTAIKIKYDDGTYSDEIPVSVLSENVEWDSTHTLVDVLGSIDVDVTGTIQDQISQLFNEKVSTSAMQDYVTNSMPTYITNWLNTNVNPVGSAVVVDSSLTVSGAAADAKIVGDEFTNVKEDLSDTEKRVLGLNFARFEAKTGTSAGVSFVSDGTIVTANNKATYNAIFSLLKFTPAISGAYRLSGTPSGGEISKYYMCFSAYTANQYCDFGNGATVYLTAGTEYILWIVVANGYTANNLIFTPSLILEMATIPTSNKILLDSVIDTGFDAVTLSPDVVSSGWALVGNGSSVQNNYFRMKKYVVSEKTKMYLHLSKDGGGVYQWQNATNVPVGTNTNIIGDPVTSAINNIVEVPVGATYLIVSEKITNVSNVVKLLDDNNIHALDSTVNPVFLTERFISHRGLVTAPENTIVAIKEAITSGYKITEFDVRFTSDNVPVLIHNDTINRTARNADGTELSSTVYVASTTYNDLLNYDFGIYKGSEYAGTKISTLADTLVVLKKNNVCCDLDMSGLGNAITDIQIGIVMDMVKEAGMLGYVMFTNSEYVINRFLGVEKNIIGCVSNVSTTAAITSAYNLLKHTKMPMVSMQYPYRAQAEYNTAHSLGLMIKAFTFSDNLSINSNLNFMPDFQIIDTLKRNEIVLT